MVFNFDGVVADLPTIKREAWLLLAQQLGLPLAQQMLHHPELQVRNALVDRCCAVNPKLAQAKIPHGPTWRPVCVRVRVRARVLNAVASNKQHLTTCDVQTITCISRCLLCAPIVDASRGCYCEAAALGTRPEGSRRPGHAARRDCREATVSTQPVSSAQANSR